VDELPRSPRTGDIPTEYGLGLAISGSVLAAESVPGMTFSGRAVPLGRWTHVAVVFGERETRLYLDGEPVHVGPATEFRGGPPFVVGCAGRGNPINHFRGRMRAVRISPGERYGGAFRPEETFMADPDEAPCWAVLIYDGRHVEGDRVIDLSGARRDGCAEMIGEQSRSRRPGSS